MKQQQNLALTKWAKDELTYQIALAYENSEMIGTLDKKGIVKLIKILGEVRILISTSTEVHKDEFKEMAKFIQRNYKQLKIDEITIAVDMALTGKLILNTRALPNFNMVFIGQVLNSYGDFRNRAITHLIALRDAYIKATTKPEPPSIDKRLQELKFHIKQTFLDFKSTGEVEDFGSTIYKFLKSINIINYETIKDINIATNYGKKKAADLKLRNKEISMKGALHTIVHGEKLDSVEISYSRNYILMQFFASIIEIDSLLETIQIFDNNIIIKGKIEGQ